MERINFPANLFENNRTKIDENFHEKLSSTNQFNENLFSIALNLDFL